MTNQELINKLYLLMNTSDEEFEKAPEFFIEEGEKLLAEIGGLSGMSKLLIGESK